jgi:ubiquinone/menaquinone biosynthesis C-methylase UbiE
MSVLNSDVILLFASDLFVSGVDTMSSLSFDPVAHIYDETRGFTDEVERQIARAIDHLIQATPQTRYLEVGVGTGRIALPLANLGHAYTGVDISEKMLARLVEKAQLAGWYEAPQAWGSLADETREQNIQDLAVQRLVRSDPVGALRLVISTITKLPFINDSFDVAIAVHIFHLVSDWEQALQEVQRVLRPGGVLLHCWDTYDQVNGQPTRQDINEKWRGFVAELGGNAQRERNGASVAQVAQWLQARGMPSHDEQVVTWRQPIVPRQYIEYVARRSWSGTWALPDDLFNASIERLWSWAHEFYGDRLDTPVDQERHFIVSRIQMPG